MRLDKLLANSGFGSRKDVKKIVKAGAVMIDGEPAKDVKTHVDPENRTSRYTESRQTIVNLFMS